MYLYMENNNNNDNIDNNEIEFNNNIMNYYIIEKNKNIFTFINKLPHELVNIIKEYIQPITFVFTNKIDYLKYHYLINIKLIPKTSKENYIRDIVRRDYYFVFERILHENYKKWFSIKNYIYKNIIYSNYIYFLKDFCFINESHKCRNILNKFLEENGLCKNQHKKNTSKHIRWKN